LRRDGFPLLTRPEGRAGRPERAKSFEPRRARAPVFRDAELVFRGAEDDLVRLDAAVLWLRTEGMRALGAGLGRRSRAVRRGGDAARRGRDADSWFCACQSLSPRRLEVRAGQVDGSSASSSGSR